MAYLTESQRYAISTMLYRGYKQMTIAKTIGKCKSVISRQLKRNSYKCSNIYKNDLAQRKYVKQAEEKPKHKHFTDQLRIEIERLLREDYSPEQIVGTFKKQGIEQIQNKLNQRPRKIHNYENPILVMEKL